MQFFNYFLLQKYHCVQTKKAAKIQSRNIEYAYWLLKVTTKGKELKMYIVEGITLKQNQ